MVFNRHLDRFQRRQEDPLPAGVTDDVRTWVVLPPTRELTPGQLAAIRTVMRLFVDDDLADGVSPHRQMYCHACRAARPMPGFIRYEPYRLCNPCATEYEVAQTSGLVADTEQFVSEKTSRDPGGRTLPPLRE